MFDPKTWAAVPFHLWSVVLFVLGCMVGSFLNVCIYRMPRGESVVSPPSHCPHCGGQIPWFLNIPLATWLWLRGKCASCRAPISPRYFLVELLTGLLFLGSWLRWGKESPWAALAYCVILAGLVAASFIDIEHFIIPDEITIGGMAVGFVISLVVPSLHHVSSSATSLQHSMIGIAAGSGIIYLIVRAGKLMFGRQRFKFESNSRVVFSDTHLVMPDQMIPYEDIFYRPSDAVILHASKLEMTDRCYWDVKVKLDQEQLFIGEEQFKTEETPGFEALTGEIVVPREAMGLGDVKFMGAIGAFLGWQGVLFSLMWSALLGSVVGVSLILAGRSSTKIPYGPYIALAAATWIFLGPQVMALLAFP